MTWRRAAMGLGISLVGVIAFGIGYLIGAMDTAKRIITIAVEVLGLEGIGAAQLFEQYLKLKGGG